MNLLFLRAWCHYAIQRTIRGLSRRQLAMKFNTIMTKDSIAKDFSPISLDINGQRWTATWYPPHTLPDGKKHGSAGICLSENNDIILISADNLQWDLPAGRPEGNETWEETLHREMLEEACVTVTKAHLLGFSCTHCIEGPEKGLKLVRSFWKANVVVNAWEPRHEINYRKIMPSADALPLLPAVFAPIFKRAFSEAGIL